MEKVGSGSGSDGEEWPSSPGPLRRISDSANERLLPEAEKGNDNQNADDQSEGNGAVQDDEKAPPPPGTATVSSFVVSLFSTMVWTLAEIVLEDIRIFVTERQATSDCCCFGFHLYWHYIAIDERHIW